MRNDSIEQILANSDKAELLDDFTKALETANHIVLMVEEPTEMDDGGVGGHTFYYLFGFRQLYEVDGFIRRVHNEIMEDD